MSGSPQDLPPDLYRALLDSMTEGVSLSREDGVIVYTNAAEDRMFGYEPGELVGRHVSVQNAYPPEENARVVEGVIAELKRVGSWRGEWRNRRKDGSEFTTTSRISAVEVEGRPHWLCVQEDVTAEQVAVSALRDSEARLAIATRAADLGVWDWDLRTGTMTYSDRAKVISGFDPHESVTFEMVRDIVHPDDYPITSAQAQRAIDPAIRDTQPYEYRIVRRDGELCWVQAHGEAVFEQVDGETRAVRYVGTLQDVTERRRLEEAERRAVQSLRLAAEAGRMAVWEVDAASDEISTSPELNRVLGFPEDAAPTLAEIRAGDVPGERERLQAIARDLLLAGERFMEAEYRYRRPDGEVRWLLLRCEMQVGPDGAPTRAVGVLTDVTERKRSEEALRASEARLKLAQQAAGAGVWEWDLTTGRSVWSAETFDLLAVDPTTPADRLVQAWVEAVHPEDRERTREAARSSADRGEPFTVEFRVLRADGNVRWVRSRGVSVLGADGRPARIAGIVTDVTDEHKEREALLARTETLGLAVAERTRERDRIYELSNDLFAVAGFDGWLKTVNPAWTRLLGWSEAELLSRPFVELIHPDDHAAAAEVIGTMVSGRAVQRFEDRLLCADGRWVWIAWAAVPEGDLFYAVGRDITREREREEALRQSQKMEAMGQLTGGVAHDFNNLLTPIVGALDMLQRRGVGGEREQRLIAGAAQSAERARTLVERLLAFARRQPLQPTPVDVAELARGMADLVEGAVGPQIKVVVDAPVGLPPARADPNQLEMALLNLSVNARDAMPDGGTLRISVDAPSVGRNDPDLRPDRYLRLSVADTGMGMDAATLARAVEPFFSTKGIGKGTGLGLSMAHGLASQLGGALRLHSAAGLGTNVELWLPESAAPVVRPSGPAPSGLDGRAAGLALLVDDEDLVRASAADMLAELGYEVREAASAEEALKLVEAGLRPDLLMTDHLMPGLTGAELARAVRVIHPSVKVLVVSGYAEADGLAADLPRLHKPFRNADLAASLACLG